LVFAFIERRSKIETTAAYVQKSHLYFLKYVKSQQDFFGYDAKNESFFENNQSVYLDSCSRHFDSLLFYIGNASSFGASEFEFDDEINDFRTKSNEVDSIFRHLVGLVYIRGYKNINLIGDMRDDAHWLENTPEVDKESLLTLRRHEKDYIIRNEDLYVQRFNFQMEDLTKFITAKNISTLRKDSIISRLEGYKGHFNELVDLNNLIGLNDNSALKAKLDNQIQDLERHIAKIVTLTEDRKEYLFNLLNLYFYLIVTGLILVSVLISYVISTQITKPLRDLTIYITKFVDSNFTLEAEHPVVRTRDEIGKLTKNFKILRDEVISSLKFFKQKVDERTAELADANQRLVKLNKANSRFVPEEFLHFLDKKGIEQISLGDQTERNMTVMFTDIRSFTDISENLSPQENFDFINNYLNEIVPIIRKHGGFIDKYIGDSIMALFPRGAESALKASIEFRTAINRFNKYLNSIGQESIIIGSGIHTGHLILGTIGTDDRMETTVISDAVNAASRVEGLTKHYGVSTIFTIECLSDSRIKGNYHYRYLDTVKVKGKKKAISGSPLLF
jgi:class 3 adenylate cyclase/HAMP domain-containing protein